MNAPTHTAESQALAVIPPNNFDLSPRNFDEAWRMAEYLSDSDMVPKDFKGKPANCLVAIQWGGELGLKTMQAIQNIAVINGRPSLWGDVMLALVRASPLCEYVVEEVSDERAVCKVKRRGEPEQTREFTRADAEQAGLWGKQGPWQQYRKRMLQMRARAWALRDVFTDVLKGLHMAEEAMDMPPAEKFMGPADVVQPGPTPAPTPAPEKAEKKAFPEDTFTEAIPVWQKAINKGKTPQDILEAVALRNPEWALSEIQKARILSLKKQDAAGDTGASVTDANAVAHQIAAARNSDELALAGDLIRNVADKAVRDELQAKYDEREAALKKG